MGEFERPFWERGLKANAPIVLWREVGQVEMGRWRFEGEITVFLDFWPTPKVLVAMEPRGLDCPDGDGEVVFRLPSGEHTMECSLVENRCLETKSDRVVLRPKQEWVIGDENATVEFVGFGIPNFPPFHRDAEVIQLQAGPWLVSIVPAAGATETCNQLKRRGGYGVTAIGRIRRIDERPFDYEEVASLMDELQFFLSFVLGQWTGLLRPTGLDERDAVVWERGSMRFLDPGPKQDNWFASECANSLGSVFRGFHERWNDLDDREAVRYAINWYVRAKSRAAGVEGALVLSVAGLEMLTFWILVRLAGTHSDEEYGDKSFGLARKLRKMFEVVGLPTGRSEMGAFVEQFGWPDDKAGPAGLNAMRNDLMHARKALPSPVYKSGWWVAQWYLELCLLWAFEYQGNYLDRRNLDSPPVPVPWASRPTA